MTPPRLIELQCPRCPATHWTIGSDYPGIDGRRADHSYSYCPGCGHSGSGYVVKQQSPPSFFIQPHDLYPMSVREFQHWLAVLKEHFPDDSRLKELGLSWYPGKERSDHRSRLDRTMELESPVSGAGASSRYVLFNRDGIESGRLGVTVFSRGTFSDFSYWLEPRIEPDPRRLDRPRDLEEVVALLEAHGPALREEWRRYVEDAREFRKESLALMAKGIAPGSVARGAKSPSRRSSLRTLTCGCLFLLLVIGSAAGLLIAWLRK